MPARFKDVQKRRALTQLTGPILAGDEVMVSRPSTGGTFFANGSNGGIGVGAFGAVGAATGVANEQGAGHVHRTEIVLTDFAVGNTVGVAALGFGALLYTLPAGVELIRASVINGGLTLDHATQTDTPEIGLGTVVASGAISVLTTTMENIFVGTAVAGVAGQVFKGQNVATLTPFTLMIPTTGGLAHTIYLNVADTWAAIGDLTFDGTIVLEWVYLGA